MSAAFHDPAVLQDRDLVRILDGGESVGDDQRGAPLSQSSERLADQLFRAGVEG